MSWLQRLLKLKPRRLETNSSFTPTKKQPTIPVVKFNASKVSNIVKADLLKNIEALSDVNKKYTQDIYDAALHMIEAGGNMPILYNALLKLNGMTTNRAREIAHGLNRKAKALIEQKQYGKLGIKYAVWISSNAPCMVNPKHPTDADRKQDAAHKAVNGKQYEIEKGVLIDGEWTFPGQGDGCKCFSRSVIPGI